MSARETRYLQALERRESFLRQRFADRPNDVSSYDRLEASALGWAIANLRQMVDAKRATTQPGG